MTTIRINSGLLLYMHPHHDEKILPTCVKVRCATKTAMAATFPSIYFYEMLNVMTDKEAELVYFELEV